MTDETQTPIDSKLEELVTKCLERVERDGDPHIDDVCKDHPELKEAVARRFAMLKRIGLLSATQSAGGAASGPMKDFPDLLGDFRLLRRVGGGGMGVVYLAKQESLGREVALKLIRPEHLYFEGAKMRFRREVEAIASLSHPGIVPIYTVGEEKGIPYYAMEHVEGSSLSEVLEALRGRDVTELTATDFTNSIKGIDPMQAIAIGERLGPSWIQGCLRVMLQVTEALSHAHGRGIIHRDIKPSNILIRRDGTAVLVDFGLALQRGASKLTQTGSALGSPHYMAPEIWTTGGSVADARSDVYALGVTLYEMLSLILPFSGQSEELLVKVLSGEFDPLRRNNPLVPWDVETVCLKAMDLDRERRYESASEFAHDLRNLLELRPIAAARPTPFMRAKRFAQRRPGSAMAVVLAFFLVVVFPLAYSAILRVKNTEIEKSNTELERQRGMAVSHRSATLGAIDVMVASLTDPSLNDVSGIEDLRKRALEQAETVVAKLSDAAASDTEVAWRVLNIQAKLARLVDELGDTKSAVDRGQKLIVEAERVFGKRPFDWRPRYLVAKERSFVAIDQHALGNDEAAEVEIRRAIDELKQVRIDAPELVDAAVVLSNAYTTLASLQYDRGRFAECEQTIKALGESLDQAIAKWPNEAALTMRWLESKSQGSLRAAQRGDSKAARELLDGVTKKFAESRFEDARSPRDQELSAVIRSNMAEVAKMLDDTPSCIAWLEGAESELRILITRYPQRPKYRILLARCLGQLAENRNFIAVDSDAGKEAAYTRSLDEFKEAIDLMHRLIAEKIKDQALEADLCATLGAYGDWLQKGQRYDDAIAVYTEDVQLLDKRLKANPNSPTDRMNLADTLRGLGYCRGLMDQADAALEDIARAWKILQESLEKKLIGDADFADLAARNRLVLASHHVDRHEYEEAMHAILEIEKLEVPLELRPDCVRKLNLCIEDATTDGAISATERTKAASEAARLAVAHLDAILKGGGTVDAFRDDPKYKALQDTPEFKAWAALHP